MTRILSGGLICCALLIANRLDAQEHPAWPARTVVFVDVPFQPLNNDFTESLSFADTTRKTENVTFKARYESERGALFSAGAGVRVVKNFGVGVTTCWFQRSSSGSFDLAVPNPLVANKPLSLTDSVSGLHREELGVHFQALYPIAFGSRTHVMLSGGPSVFRTKQDLMRSIEFDRLPGFTALKFDQALITEREKTVAGFNVAADVSWILTSHFGVGTLVRYSRATVTLDPGSETGLSRAVETHPGGLHIGGGIRFLF